MLSETATCVASNGAVARISEPIERDATFGEEVALVWRSLEG